MWLTGSLKDKYPKTDQYLSLMKRSDEALEYLIRYFEASDEPTMIVMFGDHQPSVEDEFSDEIAGMPSADVPAGDHLIGMRHHFLSGQTMNPDRAEREDERHLSRFRAAGSGRLDMTPYQRFLLSMEETLPVIHPLGCYDASGTYYSRGRDWSRQFSIPGYRLRVSRLQPQLDPKKYKDMYIAEP